MSPDDPSDPEEKVKQVPKWVKQNQQWQLPILPGVFSLPRACHHQPSHRQECLTLQLPLPEFSLLQSPQLALSLLNRLTSSVFSFWGFLSCHPPGAFGTAPLLGFLRPSGGFLCVVVLCGTFPFSTVLSFVLVLCFSLGFSLWLAPGGVECAL